MDILYTIDRNFLPQLATSMCALCENNQAADDITFHVVCDDVPKEDQETIARFVESFGRRVVLHDLEDALAEFPDVDTGSWNRVILARLLMARFVPEEVSRVLYLDADTLVVSSIQELFDMDLDGAVMGAVIEPTFDPRRRSVLGLKDDSPYVNSGVLLVDLDKWRQGGCERAVIDLCASRASELFASDQDALNILLEGKIAFLPPRYNYSNTFYLYPYEALRTMMGAVPYLDRDAYERSVAHPAIVHFLGEDRPWRAGATHRFTDAYRRFLAKTPYADTPLDTGWEGYYAAWRVFNAVTKPLPLVRWNAITRMIPAFKKLQSAVPSRSKGAKAEAGSQPAEKTAALSAEPLASSPAARPVPFSPEDHTFVVCAYGESPYLEECLASLEAQEQPTRILVVTSTPNDLIAGVAQAHDVPLVVNQGEAGIAGDWNFALSCVDTPLATIAHQDDVYLPSYARAMLEWMNVAAEQTPGVPPLIYFCDYAELRDGQMVQDAPMLAVKRKLLAPLRDLRAWTSVKARRRALSMGNAICCPSVTYNLEAVGRPVFNAGMRSNLDWEAWERLSKMKGAFVYDDAVRMCHRVHEASETSACIQDDVRTREDLELLSRFWPLPVARAINAAYSTAQRFN